MWMTHRSRWHLFATMDGYHQERICLQEKEIHGTLAISFISSYGAEYTKFNKGPVTREIFISTMKTFISEHAQIGENRLFIMDNALNHREELSSIVEQAGHKLVFNSPNSPNTNPIDTMFGFWKSRSAAILNQETAIDELANIFVKITQAEIHRCIEHVRNHIWRKIRDYEDLCYCLL